MQNSFGDGMPVNSLPSCNAALNQRRGCATQSTAQGVDISIVKHHSYYFPSPSSQVAEAGPLIQSQPSPPTLFPMSINTSLPTYQHTQLHSASSSSQGVWPTPPSTTCEGEELENYSYHGSPASGAYGAQPIAPCSAQSSVASPRSWSPHQAQQLNLNATNCKDVDHMPAYNYASCHSLQHDQQIQPQMASYENHHFPATTLSSNVMSQHEAPSVVHGLTAPDPAGVSRVESPRDQQEFSTNYTSYSQGESSQPAMQSTEANGEESTKVDEPYAQLIHRAFMSRPSHSMTLQEIYQWFRENTDKAKSDKNKGWQNSIRHNLSMNQAFVKRERRPGPDDPLTESGEAKKASEWVLEDWAVHGVQSTTRYRSKGASNRRGGQGAQARTQNNLSGRANSGRKGGLCASKSKAAASRRAGLIQTHQRSAFSQRLNDHPQDQMQDLTYSQQPALQYSLPQSRAEPVTPPDHSHNEMMLAPNSMQAPNPMHSVPMHSALLSANDPGHGYSYAPNIQPNVHHYGQTGQHHQMYGMGDITGIFQGHQAPIALQTGPGLPPTMPPDLNALFEDTEENRNRIAYPYWNEPAAGPYQA